MAARKLFHEGLGLLLGLLIVALVLSCGRQGLTNPERSAQAGAVPTASPSPAATNSAPPSAPAANATQVTFTQIQQNILQPSCVRCHADLSTYEGASALVVAGDPESSDLYLVVANGTMPPSGSLPQDQVQQIKDWITAGAKND